MYCKYINWGKKMPYSWSEVKEDNAHIRHFCPCHKQSGAGRHPYGFFLDGRLFSLIPHCCKGAEPIHNQLLRFLWPSWLPSNSKEWTIPSVWTESPNYSCFQKRKVGRGTICPYPVYKWIFTAPVMGKKTVLIQFQEVFGGGDSVKFSTEI